MEEIVISITAKNVREKLVATLESMLLEDNFKLKRSNSFIVRKSKNKTESVFFKILNYWPLCAEIEHVLFDIRFDKVEEIVNPFLAKYNFSNIEGTKTTSTIGNLISYNTKVVNFEDVDNFIALNMNNIKAKVLAYFIKYSTMNEANVLMKEQILNDDSGLYYVERNIMQSLTLMKLCNDSDFEYLSQTYIKLYSSWGGFSERGLMTINDLIEYLSNNTN
jgi:hypothetical protein